MTIMVWSSHGGFKVCRETGKVIESMLTPEFGVPPLRVDTQELESVYSEIPSSLDILDIGYWTQEGYTPPCFDWRSKTKTLIEKGGYVFR